MGRCGSFERDVFAVGNAGILGHDFGGLAHRLGLPGECGLISLEGVDLDQPKIGGNHLAGLDTYDVAGHELGTRHLSKIATSQHLCRRDRKPRNAAIARSARYSCTKPTSV